MTYEKIKCEKCFTEIKSNCIARHVRSCNGPKTLKKRIAWNKGLDKSDPRIQKLSESLSKSLLGRPGRTPSVETKRKLSVARTTFMKQNPHLTRRKPSWMEITFAEILDNAGINYKREVHFWNNIRNENYFVDFLFENLKLIIELDGNQHDKRKIQDQIRDEFLLSIGYRVKRISHREFKRKWESKTPISDYLGGTSQ